MTESVIIPVIIVGVSIILSALFSGCETGIISLNVFQLTAQARQGSKRAQLLAKLIKKQEDLLTGLLAGNNMINITSSAVAASLAGICLGTMALRFLQ